MPLLVEGGQVHGVSDYPLMGPTSFIKRIRTPIEILELYSVPPEWARLPHQDSMPPSSKGGQVHGFQLTPDGAHVVYQADQETNGVKELYSEPVFGGEVPVKLNDSLSQGRNVRSFLISLPTVPR